MKGDFLIIHKNVLPPFYEKVVQASRLIEEENKSISDVCKELDISRSTFYKYKDKVFVLKSEFGRKAIISFKNISATELDMSANDLMERFVRGDKSRNTEGSGLGLSIAESLTKLQNGEFDIQLDGDLFKIVITFPIIK